MAAASPDPFLPESAALRLPNSDEQMTLTPMLLSSEEEVHSVAVMVCAQDPWKRYGRTVPSYKEVLLGKNDALNKLVVRNAAGKAIAVLLIKPTWLKGPYISGLCVDPAYHNKGIGRAVLGWVEDVCRANSVRNMFICASHFNEGAQRLYHSFGFKDVGLLEDLSVDGIGELLMRKKLF